MPEKINKMPDFYTIFARKNSFRPNLGGNWGAVAPPPSLPPVSYAYDNIIGTFATHTMSVCSVLLR